ncbi:MAG: ATP-binding protein [Erysipelotrichaceae bacterium]|nr:ATP-binding protein [Erysipelotrichaceae bacterium]
MEIKKIVLTGGPCGGKSTGLEYIRREYEKKGWRVLAVDECATEIIKSGIAPGKSNTNFDFELPIVQLQKAKEEIFEQAARQLPDEKVLIIYDRGFLDMKTYCSDLEFEQICQAVKMSEEEMKHRYDGIFHLTTTAKGAEEYYTFANNEARYQNLEEARKADDAILEVWKGHPFIRVIDNSTSFQSKMNRLQREIDHLLNESSGGHSTCFMKLQPSALGLLPRSLSVQSQRFVNTPLVQKKSMERSLLQIRDENGAASFFLEYRPAGSPEADLTQQKISRNEYSDLLLESAPGQPASAGKIHSFFWDGQYAEIIQDASLADRLMLKITTRKDAEPKVPDFLLPELL